MKVLILGGYGVFGGRLARLLLQDGVEVIVAGRDARKAAAFTARYGGSPLGIDIRKDLSPIADAAPALVVDAAGPFQAYGGDPYRLAWLCIAHKIGYLDFSDDAAFAAGIATLDEAARAAGCFALSGVSSVPAISAAAVRKLSEGLSDIALIETALVPGNRAPRGRSVIRSILAQAGEPLAMWRGGAWRRYRGWADARRVTFGPGLKRWASLIGAPDLTLFPQAFGARSVVFRAGLELGAMHWGLALLARLRAARLLPPLTLLTAPILWASLLLKPFGTDRGGMTVDVTGLKDGRPVRRRWELIATGGDGPFIPAVPARAIVRKLSAIPPGARPCLFDLTLAEIEDATRGLAVEFATREEEVPALFERVLARDWPALPASIRRLHSVRDLESFCGHAQVTRGTGLLARLAGWLLNFPPAGEDIALTVTKTRVGDTEIWERDFAGRIFRSRWSLSPRPGHARERLFGITVEAELEARGGCLHYSIRRGWLAGIPLPAFLLPKAQIREYDEGGAFYFDVALHAPLTGGLIVRYRGQVAANT
jgi:saccharopine dehydrogenase-like NADP-dependent oxidoreductase